MLEFGGLDLSRPDELSREERNAFGRFYEERFDHRHEGLEWMLEHRPDALKRFRLFVKLGYQSGDPARPFNFGFFIYYAFTGYEIGVRYTVRARQRLGLTRDQFLDAVAIAFLRVGPAGAQTIARAFAGYEWLEPSAPLQAPPSWDPHPDLLRSGIDFSSPELSDADIDRLFDWYRRVPGEIPPHVTFLAEHRPAALKSYRARMEHTVKVLPPQTMPLSLLAFDTLRGSVAGVRENLLLCKALGVSKSSCVEAIVAGMEYGGPDNVDTAAAAADVFEGWI